MASGPSALTGFQELGQLLPVTPGAEVTRPGGVAGEFQCQLPTLSLMSTSLFVIPLMWPPWGPPSQVEPSPQYLWMEPHQNPGG